MADQFWSGDSFAEGATVYGSSPALYHPIVPWGASPEGTTGFSLSVSDGKLFDGYRGSATEGQAVAVNRTGLADTSNWFALRDVYASGMDVAASFSISMQAGSPNNDTFRQFGVAASVSGGTSTFPGGTVDTQVSTDVSGYFLIEAKQAGFRHRVFLLQVTNGAINVLQQEDVRDTDPAHSSGSAASFFQPTSLRLTLTPNGGGVDLDCFRTTVAGVEARLFGGTSTLGTALPAGRAGFGLQTRFTDSQGAVPVGMVDTFAVRSEDRSSLLFAERFERVLPDAGQDVTDGVVTGRSLMQAWVGDAHTRPTATGSTLRTVGNASLGSGAGDAAHFDFFTAAVTNQAPGWGLWQNPPTTTAQRFSVELTRTATDPATPVEAGLLLRFGVRNSPNVDARARDTADARIGNNAIGYHIAIREDGGVYSITVRHFDGTTTASSYQGVEIATASLLAFGLAAGVTATLDAEIRNFDGDSLGEGTLVGILIRVNGTTVTPIANAVPGIAVVDSILTDSRSVRTQARGAVGIAVVPDTVGGTGLVDVANFAPGTLSVTPGLEANEQETVPVPTETDGLDGTLDLPLVFVQTVDYLGDLVIARNESGKLTTWRPFTRTRRSFECVAVFENDDWLRFLTRYEANGGDVPFTWTDPRTREEIPCLFEERSVEFGAAHIENGRAVYGVTFTLIELFDNPVYNPLAP